MARFRSPRWLTALALCAVLPALVFSADVPGPPVRLLRALLDAGTANRVVVNDGSGLLSDAAAITPSRVLLSNGSGIPVANGALSTNRVNYWDGSGLVSAAALTSGRVLLADANGLPTNNPALSTNRLVYADATGLVSNAALTASRLPLTDANGLLTVHSALTANRVVLSGADGLLDVNAALTANRVLLSDASGFPVASTVTNTTLGYLDPTSSIQTQINALSSAAGLKLLATYTPSSAASVDITSQISATYDHYFVTFDLRPATDGVNLYIRTDSDNGASFEAGATDYVFHSITQSAASTVTGSGSTGAPALVVTQVNTIGNATNEGIAGYVTVDYLGSASMYPIINYVAGHWTTVTVHNYIVGGGSRPAASAINALQFLFSSGNVASGKVRIYGYAN